MKKRLKLWHIILIVVVVIGGGGGGYYWYRSANSSLTATTSTAQQYTVAYGNISNTVSASGSVVYPTKQSMTFGNSGTVTEIDVNVGDSVTSGQVLAKIDLSSTIASLQQAVATDQINLQNAQINLADTQANILQAQLAVANDQVALENAQNNLTKAQTPYTQAEIAQAQSAVLNDQIVLDNAKQDLSDTQNNIVSEYTDQVNQAQLAVANDQVAVENAQTALTAVQSPSQADIAQDQLNEVTAQNTVTTVIKCGDDSLCKLVSRYARHPGFFSYNLNRGAIQLNIAQAALTTAQNNLANVVAGPDPLIVSQAEQRAGCSSGYSRYRSGP